MLPTIDRFPVKLIFVIAFEKMFFPTWIRIRIGNKPGSRSILENKSGSGSVKKVCELLTLHPDLVPPDKGPAQSEPILGG